MEQIEEKLIETKMMYCGVDEAGAGPLCGDVVAAAVILDPQNPITILDDSKKLSEKKRLIAYDEIKEKAIAWSVGRCTPKEIDEINILNARMLAMVRAVEGLQIQPGHALIDGNKIPQGLQIPADAIVKGDGLIKCISAASIIAKVDRDRDMEELDKLYPGYGLAKHKGYPTKAHLEALKELGPTNIYRKSYGPVKALIEQPEFDF